MTTRTRWRHSHCLVLRARNSGMWDNKSQRAATPLRGRGGDCPMIGEWKTAENGGRGRGRAGLERRVRHCGDLLSILSFHAFNSPQQSTSPPCLPACLPACLPSCLPAGRPATDRGRCRRLRQRRDRLRRAALPPAAVVARHATPDDAAAASVNI